MKTKNLMLLLVALLMVAGSSPAWSGAMYLDRVANVTEHVVGNMVGAPTATTDVVFEIDFQIPAARGDAAGPDTQDGFKVHYNDAGQATWWRAHTPEAPGIGVYWEFDGAAKTVDSSLIPFSVAYHDGATATIIDSATFVFDNDWHRIKLTIASNNVSVEFDGVEYLSGAIPTGSYDLSSRSFLVSSRWGGSSGNNAFHTRWDNIVIEGTALEDFETVANLIEGDVSGPSWLTDNRFEFHKIDAAVNSDATGMGGQPTPTPTPTPTPAPTPIPGAQDVLLIGNNQPDNLGGDRQIFEVLAYQLLLDVTFVNAGAATAADAINKDIIIISGTVGSGSGPGLNTTFGDNSLPIILSKPAIADDFGLSDGTGAGGQVNATTMTLILDTDILTSGTGWTNGVVDIYKNPGIIIWDNNPTADATVVATYPTDNNVLYYYEPGDTMAGNRTAPNYRGFFFADVNGFGGANPETNLTTESVQVLRNMVELFAPYVAPVNEARRWEIYQ